MTDFRARNDLLGEGVLFIYRVCGLGGVETSLLAKIEALAKHGIKASALFGRFWGEGGRELAKVTPAFHVEEDSRLFSESVERHRTGPIVVIDSPEYLPLLRERAATYPVYFESHASYPPSLESYASALKDFPIAGLAVPTQFNGGLLRRLIGEALPLAVIPNSIDAKRWAAHPVGQPPSWFNPEAGPVVFFVGRLEPQKDPLSFVEIARRVLHARQDVRFVLVGDAVDLPEYARSVKAMTRGQPAGQFTFLDRIAPHEMPWLYRLARLSGGSLLSTSKNESQPMIFLEAMAAGCPIVTTEVGGVLELLEDGVNGRTFRTGDIERGAASVIEVLQDEVLRRRITGRARETVEHRHSPYESVVRYLKLFGVPIDGQ